MIGLGPALGESDARIARLEHGRLTWLLIERPGQAELETLGDVYGIHALNLDDLVSRTERPKHEKHGDYEFVVLHFPVLLARPRRLAVGELHLIVGREYLIAVHDGDLRPLVRLFDELESDAEKRAEAMTSAGRLAYTIVMQMHEASAPVVERLSGVLESLQEDVFGVPSREPVYQIALLRREVIQLRRMLRPAPAIVTAMSGPDLTDYWRNAQDQLQRLVEYLDDVWQTLEALSHSYDQLASHQTSRQMRGLTLASTVLLPLAVVTGVYGMNIRGLPWADSEYAFELMLVTMAVIAVGSIALFRRRGWI